MKYLSLALLMISLTSFASGPLTVTPSDRVPKEGVRNSFVPIWEAGRLVASGTGALNTGTWYRDGQDMVISIAGHCGSTGGGTAGILKFLIPGGYNAIYTGWGISISAESVNLGNFHFLSSGVYQGVFAKPSGFRSIAFTQYESGSTNFQGTNIAADCRFGGNLRVPIKEWSGL